MNMQEFFDECEERGSHWTFDLSRMHELFHATTLTREQSLEIHQRFPDDNMLPFKHFMATIGFEGQWARFRYDVWFDNENDAIKFRLSLP